MYTEQFLYVRHQLTHLSGSKRREHFYLLLHRPLEIIYFRFNECVIIGTLLITLLQ